MNVPEELRYTKDHEWVRVLDDGTIRIGITDFAQSELGDIVFVETSPAGTVLKEHDTFGTVEAVKTVADLFAPVSGEIVAVNDALDSAEVVNSDPYGDGWMIAMKISDPAQLDALMSADRYREIIGE